MSYSSELTPELLDMGKRASDIVNTYVTGLDWDELKTKVIAIRLSDGGSDGVLYDSKRDAVRHQHHEQQCAYVALRNLMAGSRPREMAIFLKFNRDAYENGFRLTDPDDVHGGKELLMTAARYDELKRKAEFPRVDINKLLGGKS